MTRKLTVELILEIDESSISDEGVADLVSRGAIESLQRAGSLGLITATATSEIVSSESDSN